MTHSWQDLAGLTPQFEKTLPAAREDLLALTRDLRHITELQVRADRRLMTIDLDNLISGASRIAEMRGKGRDAEALAEAEENVVLLARDMRARATEALRSAAAEVVIHTSIAARNARAEVSEADMTREFRLLAAVSSDAVDATGAERPGMLARTGFSHDDGLYGRLSGRFLYDPCPKGDHAPMGSVVLPRGAAVHLQAGERLTLHHEGMVLGVDAVSPPKPKPFGSVLVEAEGAGMTLYGPAVISKAPAGSLLAQVDQGREAGTKPDDGPTFGSTIVSMVAGFLLIFLGSALGMLNGVDDPKLGAFASCTQLVAFLSGILFMVRGILAIKNIKDADHAPAPAPAARRGVSMNVWPAARALTGPEGRVPVMAPLLALPAPTPEEMMAGRAARQMVAA